MMPIGENLVVHDCAKNELNRDILEIESVTNINPYIQLTGNLLETIIRMETIR